MYVLVVGYCTDTSVVVFLFCHITSRTKFVAEHNAAKACYLTFGMKRSNRTRCHKSEQPVHCWVEPIPPARRVRCRRERDQETEGRRRKVHGRLLQRRSVFSLCCCCCCCCCCCRQSVLFDVWNENLMLRSNRTRCLKSEQLVHGWIKPIPPARRVRCSHQLYLYDFPACTHRCLVIVVINYHRKW